MYKKIWGGGIHDMLCDVAVQVVAAWRPESAVRRRLPPLLPPLMPALRLSHEGGKVCWLF